MKFDFLKPKIVNEQVDKEYKLKGLLLVGTILVSSIVITNVIGTKIMTLLGFNFTAGVITYAAVFWATDVIGEIWGKRTSYYFVILGFLGNVLLIIFTQLAIISPPAVFWVENQEAYAQILGSVWRIVAASMLAYLVSQFHDVWSFDFWRRKTKGKHLWFRNILSTITSQFLDTFIFILVAFTGILTWGQMFSMIVGQIIIKWGLALIDTPFIYLAIKVLKKPVDGAHN